MFPLGHVPEAREIWQWASEKKTDREFIIGLKSFTILPASAIVCRCKNVYQRGGTGIGIVLFSWSVGKISSFYGLAVVHELINFTDAQISLYRQKNQMNAKIPLSSTKLLC